MSRMVALTLAAGLVALWAGTGIRSLIGDEHHGDDHDEHGNSAKVEARRLFEEETFFAIATDTNIDGDPPLVFTPQDKADLLAYLKLL